MKKVRRLSQRGVVLIFTLWILATLSLLSLGLAYRTRLEIRLSSLQFDELKTLCLVKKGVSKSIVILGVDNNSYDALSEDWGKEHLSQTEEGTLSLVIRDEDSRVNINFAQREQLAKLPNMTNEVVVAIVKNRPFNLPVEILKLDGVTSEIYYGNQDFNQVGLKDLVTVWTDGKININTASREVLLTIPGVREGVVESLLAYREDTPFASLEELKDVTGITLEGYSQLSKFGKVSSKIFTIISSGKLENSNLRRTITTRVRRTPDSIEIISWGEN